MPNEFDLIDHIVATLGDVAAGAGVALGPGDDAAVLTLPPGCQLVVSTDTLVAGRHYPEGAAPDAIGYRALAVATSDLAAMGAAAAWAVVSLTAERLERAWTAGFAEGLKRAAARFGLAVVGGNLARGPQSVTVTVHGHLPHGAAITRAGAKTGDAVYVTGELGAAKLALGDVERLRELSFADLDDGEPPARYWRPTPRLAVGVGLRGVASAALDISDGLASDLDHLCQASGVRCEVEVSKLPVAAGCDPLMAASGGDDYELVFTAPPARAEAVRRLANDTDGPITAIGTVRPATNGCRRTAWFQDGKAVRPAPGYRHF